MAATAAITVLFMVLLSDFKSEIEVKDEDAKKCDCARLRPLQELDNDEAQVTSDNIAQRHANS